MQYTNRYSLPEPLVSAIKKDPYTRAGNISVTDLIKAPQIRYLERKHQDEITVDVSDEIYLLLGSAVHEILSRAGDDNAIHEKRLSVKVHGWEVTGITDRYEPESGTLIDAKVTSVYSFLLGEKPEWTAQLNCYAALWRTHGYKVKGLRILAILRDWTKRRALSESDYPAVPALMKDIPLWSQEKAVQYIKQRVSLHQRAEKWAEYPDCTDEDRWARPATWAVKKKGNKRAKKVFHDEEAADSWAKMMNDCSQYSFIVETRPGMSVRCEQGYCKVANWCPQFKKDSIESGQETEH